MPECMRLCATRRSNRGLAAARFLGGPLLLAGMLVGSSRSDEPLYRAPPSQVLPVAGSQSDPSRTVRLSVSGSKENGDHWHHNLIRERTVEVRIRTARLAIEAGRTAEALSALQAVLDRADDLFVRLDDHAAPAGAHTVCEQVIGSLPGDTLAAYEALYGSEARRLLQRARAEGSLEMLAQVAGRFFHTAAGFEAIVLIAHQRLDHGASAAAADCWQRLLTDPAHSRRLKPAHRVAAAVSFARAGRLHESRSVIDGFSNDPVRLGGAETSAGEAVYRLTFPLPGTFDSAASTRGATPVHADPHCPVGLSQPRWSVSLAGTASQHVADLVRPWQVWQIENGLPLGAAQFAVVVGSTAIFRDYEGLRAIDLESGENRWFYKTNWSPAASIPPRPAGSASEGNPDPNNTLRGLVGNSQMGMLAADRSRVYAVDQLEGDQPVPAAVTPADSSGVSAHPCNLLLALSARADEAAGRLLWTIGGSRATDDEKSTTSSAQDGPARDLAGHYFLGPPLVLDDRLYAISECQQQLWVSCLRSDTARLLWTQAFCSVPQPISSDHLRWGLVCTPSYGEGVLVCPTQVGVLAALDPLTGRLLWAASQDDHETQLRQQMSAWPYGGRRRCAHPGYANLPLIRAKRVVYLAAHSEYVQCVDVHTGRMLWRTSREDLDPSSASEYVAAIEGGVVAVVGRRQCRGLDLATGQTMYRLPLASSPSGRGVQQEATYSVPLADGTVVSFELVSGRPTGIFSPTGAGALGNLTSAGALILSTGRTDLLAWTRTALPMAVAGNSNPDAPEKLRAATDSALQRGALLTTLSATAADRGALLTELTRRAGTPETKGTFLLERGLFELKVGRQDAVKETVADLVKLDVSRPVPVLSDPARCVVPAELLAVLLDRAKGQAIQSQRLQDGRAAMEQARALIASGRVQAAELMLAHARQCSCPETAAIATGLLADIWRSRQPGSSAVQMLQALPSPAASDALGHHPPEMQHVTAYRGDVVSGMQSRPAAPGWSGTEVRISETRAENEILQALYNVNQSGQSLLTPRSVPFELLDKGRGGPAVRFVLVDRATGLEQADSIQLPGRFSPPVIAQADYLQHSFVGNFVPIGTVGAVHGLSLLERKVLWTTALPELTQSRDPVRVGPAGPRFVACQYRQHLFVLDPIDGRLKWHRDDLEPMSGLMIEQGMIGDERVLAVFTGTGGNYTLYDTASGEELRRAKLDFQPRPVRRSFGRLLFHCTTGDSKQMRVWDVLSESCVWHEAADEIAEAAPSDGMPPGGKLMSYIRDTDEVAYLTCDGRLRVVDLPRGRLVFELPLAGTLREGLICLRAFRDQQRYYVHLNRARAADRSTACDFIRDSNLPLVHLQGQGDLLAVDARTHELLWHKSLGVRSVLHLPEYREPLLVTAFRLRKPDQTLTLGVEILDAATGRSLASRDDLLSDRLLQAIYEPAVSAIVLRGGKTVIRLEFAAAGSTQLKHQAP